MMGDLRTPLDGPEGPSNKVDPTIRCNRILASHVISWRQHSTKLADLVRELTKQVKQLTLLIGGGLAEVELPKMSTGWEEALQDKALIMKDALDREFDMDPED